MRARAGRLVAALVWAAIVVFFAWMASAGQWEALVDVAPWVLLLGWFAYVTQWLPKVVIGRRELTVVNGLRTHVVPYDAITEMEARYSVVLRLKDRSIHCWGAPLPDSALGAGLRMQRAEAKRPYTILPSNERISLVPARSEGRSLIVAAWEEATHRYKPDGGKAVSTWFLPAVVTGGALLAWTAVAVFS